MSLVRRTSPFGELLSLLRLTTPKMERAKPRHIALRTDPGDRQPTTPEKDR